jgi:DNA replication and repair protein RecF
MLSNIEVVNYRNIERISAELSPQSNYIIAPNGSGKTNLIESIYYSIFGESFRPIEKLDELMGNSEDFTKVSLDWDFEKLEMIISKKEGRKFLVNQKRITLSKIPQKFPVILFAPQSVDLVAREPGVRRQDLDNFLGTINIRYRDLITDYKKVLKNRNALIKMIRDRKSERSELRFWTDKLVTLSDEIFTQRIDFFNNIDNYIKSTVSKLDSYLDNKIYITLEAKYISSLELNNGYSFKDILSKKFSENEDKEIIVGKTLYGIHKDDFQLNLAEKNLRFLGSRGQQRVGVLLFKLSQYHFYQSIFNKSPVLLIDDLMSELDNQNREKLANILINSELQFLLSSADENEVPSDLKTMGRRLVLNDNAME